MKSDKPADAILDQIAHPEARDLVAQLIDRRRCYIKPEVASFSMKAIAFTEPLVINGIGPDAGGGTSPLARPACITCGTGVRRRPGVLNFRWRAPEPIPGQPAITGYDAAVLNGGSISFLAEDDPVLEVAVPGFAAGSYTVLVRAVFADGSASDWVATTCVVLADVPRSCPGSNKGMILGWFNPIEYRTESTATLCSGNAFTATSNFDNGSDYYGSVNLFFSNQGFDPSAPSDEKVFLDKLNITLAFQDLFTGAGATGKRIKLLEISAGDPHNATATYLDTPAGGFPVAATWDFSGNDWTAALYWGKADGTWQQIDTVWSTEIYDSWPSGGITTGTTLPLSVGAALASGFEFFQSSADHGFGGDRIFLVNVGNTDTTYPTLPIADPALGGLHMWDSVECSQWGFFPGQLLDMSSITNARKFWDDASSPKWAPKDWGPDASGPTGTAASWYFNGTDLDTFLANKGSAGGRLLTVKVTTDSDSHAPTDSTPASTIPATSTGYQAVGIRFGQNNGGANFTPLCGA